MTSYHFKAMTNAGAVISGILDAPSETDAVRQLRSEGHFPLWAKPVGNVGPWSIIARFKPKIGRSHHSELGLATRELASLLGAGLELDRALTILVELREVKATRQAFLRARAGVRDGKLFSDALARERMFPPFFVSMVRAGEAHGSLSQVLGQLATYLQRTAQIRETVLSALIYPVVLLVTSAISIIIILTFVLPQFEPLFSEAGRTLPLPTRIVMDIGWLFRTFWWLAASLLIGGWVFFRRAMKSNDVKRKVDSAMLKLPIIGPLLRDIDIERFLRSFSTLIANGITVPTALTLAGQVLSNSEIAAAVHVAIHRLREGESLAAQLGKTGVFPGVTLDLIQIGEETGRLDYMLLHQADLDEMRIRQKLDRLLALLVPGLTVILGLIVAGLIASMMMAILSVNDLALQ